MVQVALERLELAQFHDCTFDAIVIGGVIPLYADQPFRNLKITVGLWIYDLMAGLGNPHAHKRISAEEVRSACPGVQTDRLIGGLVYGDCRTDDSRHTLEVLKAACGLGSIALNYARVTGYHYENGRVYGVDVVDSCGGPDADVVRLKARTVINATGVWSQQMTELTGSQSSTVVVPAKGVHLTVSRKRLQLDCAMILPSPHDKRFCFAIPWYHSVIIGTTDTEYDGDIENLRAETSEQQYCLDAANAMFPDLNLTLADVTGAFAGLRPLVRPRNAPKLTAELARSHHLEETADGLIVIAGGKLTTARVMARDTVDLVCKIMRRLSPGREFVRCRTDRIMLGGWNLNDDVTDRFKKFRESAWLNGLNDKTGAYLPTIYGAATAHILKLAIDDQSLCQLVVPEHPYILAQVVYAVRAEAARTIEDVLSRRIRLTITDRNAALQAGGPVSHVMAAELSWSETERLAELEKFTASLT
ncbi:MAG: FAD-dependent oxidoreductase [Candidatus Melainabacteria bacterium]|nr:FAD-dependent oxidoreductase [Candidatus Melainabacteria bacterium]